MALWDKITSRGNVEDRRGMAPIAGGVGLGGIALLILFNVLTGGDPADILGQLQNVPLEQSGTNSQEFEGEDSYEAFASTVLGSNNEMWQTIATSTNRSYEPPRLVLFRTATASSCGTATSSVGPHFCPLDGTIYLDETFFDELENRLGATGGDVAEAYVIAHEVAHHAQNQFGIMEQVQNSGNSNESSIKLELQADCFAGLWANSIKDFGILEPNEIKEAMDAASAVGDDRIQEKVTGSINPESWTHGSADQRVKWFTKGYETGQYESCNTFN